MKFIYSNVSNLLIVVVLLCVNMQVVAQFSQNEDQQLVIGHADTVFSETLQEQRDFWVHMPEKIEADKKYPVIYVRH